MHPDTHVRALYSFPHKLGASRICTTAWHQVNGLAASGAVVTVFAGSICRPLPQQVHLRTTLSWNAWKKARIPYRLLGSLRACALHDYFVASSLKKLAGSIDVVHVWPTAALHTLREAKRLGMMTVLERPNCHTRYAYEVVARECERLGVVMPPRHEHAYKADVLAREEAEYELADWLLCPSDFVARTFVEQGFPPAKLLRHQYGYDGEQFFCDARPRDDRRGLRVLFAGGCAPRKGLHYALDAWLQSPACASGTFRIAGAFIPGYADRLSSQLSHPSVQALGHRDDIPDLMRESDVLILPSIEEGSALVTFEARACGCVLLVSDASGAVCSHGDNAFIHPVGDVRALADQLTLLSTDTQLLARMRASSLNSVNELTWTAAGRRLHQVYAEAIERREAPRS